MEIYKTAQIIWYNIFFSNLHTVNIMYFSLGFLSIKTFFSLVLFQAILFIRQARQNKSLVGEIFTYRNRSPCKQGPYNVFPSSLTPLVHIQMSDGQMILEPQTWCPECQKRKVRNFLVKSNNSTMILIDMFL